MEKLEQFKKLGLSDKTLKALAKKGYEQPTPIQALTIPALLNGNKNIIGQAQTGTGKTAAFSLPILESFETTKNVQAIVLAPTRELALQVAEEMNSLAHGKKIRITPVYGGQSIEFQIKQLKKGTDIIVGTPGRVIDLIERKLIHLQNLKYFILDEADEMLNMGFLEDIEKILSFTNENKRMLFFSATMPNEIMKIAKKYMKDYEILAVKARELTTDLTDQIYFEVHEKDKFEALCRIIDLTKDFYGIVFCRTKNDANDLVGKLNDRGYDAEGLHGDISQNYREITLKRFKSKKINVLVATDVAARGIDVNDLSHVINYSIPQEAESYVHRIGRTGRAGKEGTAITFITPQEYRRLLQIQRIVKTEIRKERVPDIKDVIQAKKFRLMEELNSILVDNNYDNFKEFAKELLNGEQALDLVAALLKHAYDDILDENSYNEISEVKLEKSGKVRLFIALGRKNGMTPKKLVNYVIKKSKIDDKKIKNIEVFDSFSFMSVPFTEAEIILDTFHKDKNGKKPLVEKAKDKSTEENKRKEKNFLEKKKNK
ncbi:DEAD-box ATP-dependent RNA helicase CshA [Fusobacterium necrogenes]|uniref:RNA helicase n=1 Tax=Fusobacterium necrogenes TaxID=858 RepID=A0A377GVU1_9FUSO|nr:DEAD/DEAH box helicase [Fusobacterium necrogenes]STO31069.1 DEAD-box ATP-dependent RNA helicase CshA [Fusobacterium necrogenes]